MTAKNRIWLAPMCQYHCFNLDGVPEGWHFAHYGARAIGGFGLITAESTAVVPEGRISPKCTGIWNDEQQAEWSKIVDFVHTQGAKMAIQLNHAGRKASTVPNRPGEELFETQTVPVEHGGWTAVAPSPIAGDDMLPPQELDRDEIRALPDQFAAAARRAVEAGFDAIELHGAHGYLLHQFLSPIANQRTDSWGGSFENRTRLIRLVTTAVRTAVGEAVPVIVRLSGTDWIEDRPSWDLDQTAMLAGLLRDAGADFISVSSGGVTAADIPVGPNYQVQLAEEVKRRTEVPTGAVGLITAPEQAEAILGEGRADTVYLGRAALRDPNWPLRAAHELGVGRHDIDYPGSYVRGAWVDPR